MFAAWALYIKWPHLPDVIDAKLKPLRWMLENKYCFDWFNENVLAAGQPSAGQDLLEGGRQGHHRRRGRSMAPRSTIGLIAGVVRRVQSGFLYSYAFWMVIGLAVMLGWFLTRA